MMPPRHPMPHIVAAILGDVLLLWAGWRALRYLWWPWFLTCIARMKRRALLRAGRTYVKSLPPGDARERGEDALQRRAEELENWPEPWECLAWATTREIERELRRRK
jgi:hypothetical protein